MSDAHRATADVVVPLLGAPLPGPVLALLVGIVVALVVGSLVVRHLPVDHVARQTVAAGWLAATLYAVGVWSWVFVLLLDQLAGSVHQGHRTVPWVWPSIAVGLTLVATTIGWALRHRIHRRTRAPLGSAFAAAVATTTIAFAAATATYAVLSSWLPHLDVVLLEDRQTLSLPVALGLAVIGLLTGWWWRSRWHDDRPLLRASGLLAGVAACAGVVQTGVAFVYFGSELTGLAPALAAVLLLVAVAALHLALGPTVPRRLLAACLGVGGTLVAIGGGASVGLYAAAIGGWWFPGYVEGPRITVLALASAALLVVGTILLTAVDVLRAEPQEPGP